jgi:hypothetical protein
MDDRRSPHLLRLMATCEAGRHNDCPGHAPALIGFLRCSCQCHDGSLNVLAFKVYGGRGQAHVFHTTATCTGHLTSLHFPYDTDGRCRCVCHLCLKSVFWCEKGDHNGCDYPQSVYNRQTGSMYTQHCGCACHVFFVGQGCERGLHSVCPGIWTKNIPNEWPLSIVAAKHCTCSCHLYSALATAARTRIGIPPRASDTL